jgi:hypothetical protein
MLRNDNAPTVVLDGTWDFRLGIAGAWSTIRVPGCWEAKGYSKWVDGPAEYRRVFTIPDQWVGSRVILEFDAVSYACTVNVNGQEVGVHRGIWTPFAFDITDSVTFGGENLLSVIVYKPGAHYPLRSTLAGFLPDVATTFGGIWQSVRLRSVQHAIQDLRLKADGETGILRVTGRAQPLRVLPAPAIDVQLAQAGEPVIAATCQADEAGDFDLMLEVPNPVLWTPAAPALYDVAVEVKDRDGPLAAAHERIGFRWLAADGERLQFNGTPICVRGVLHWGWNPEGIAPSFTDTAIRAELRLIRSLGFNLVKLCLFVPNRRYYEIADEEGMLLWQEWPLWLPEITPELRTAMPAEYSAYMQVSAHHPSIVLYSIGCELPGNVDAGLLTHLDTTVRQAISGALVCDNSGSSEAYGAAELDLADFYDYHTYTDLHFFEPMLDHWRRDWRPARPWIFGEFNDSDGFRDLAAITAANDGQKPWWLTEDNPVHTWRPEVRALIKEPELLQQAQLGFSAQELVAVSRRQSLAVLKFVLEVVRRRAGMGGYVVIGIRDTPIITSGVLDDFGRPKWPASAFISFNDDAILCLETNRRRSWHAGGDRPERSDLHSWWSGSEASFQIVLNNAGSALHPDAEIHWQFTEPGGSVVAQGKGALPAHGTLGAPYRIATLTFQLPEVQAGTAFHLRVWLTDPTRSIHNQWPIWIFPHPMPWPGNVAIYDPSCTLASWGELSQWGQCEWAGQAQHSARLVVATAIDERLIQYVANGRAVLFLQQHDGPLPCRQVPFWRESIKLIYPHPIWQRFPHEGYADLQFFGMATEFALDTEQLHACLPAMTKTRPVLRRLDAREFHVLDHLVELEIGAGRMLVSTLRHQGGAGAQPTGLERNVAGYFLLDAMITYLLQSSDSKEKETQT